MHSFVITGRFTHDIELSNTPRGKIVAEVRVATDRKYDRTKTDYFLVTLWEGLAETCAKHSGGKGRLVRIDGRVEHNVTGEGDDRQHHYNWIAEEVEFLGAKPRHEAATEPAASEVA